MAATFDRIQKAYREAMKARAATAVQALRLLVTSLQNEEKEKRSPLSDEDVAHIVQREAKKRREAIALYEQGNDRPRADAEKAELAVLEPFLPQLMDAAAITAAVDRVVADVHPAGPQDFGKVMGIVMKELKGKADGSQVQAAVKKALKPAA